jgi:hypothetical protein
MSYNGWHNYETWCVNLWLDNEESSYRYWRSMAEEAWEAAEARGSYTKKESAVKALAETLCQEYTDNMPVSDGVYGDVLQAAFSEVDWQEIATALLEEYEEEDEEEEEEGEDDEAE